MNPCQSIVKMILHNLLQNLELTHEARAARALRDELDIQRERANKVHLLETELQSFKDKMSQMESLKSRIGKFIKMLF